VRAKLCVGRTAATGVTVVCMLTLISILLVSLSLTNNHSNLTMIFFRGGFGRGPAGGDMFGGAPGGFR
jgi:hypothetical protein